MTWKLNIRRESVRPDLTVLQVDGRLGSASSGALIEAIVRAIEAGDRQLVVDLANVDYISSAGLLALDAAAGRTHVAGGTLILCGLTEPVRLAFDLSGLLPHFSVETTRAVAIAKLSANA